MMAMNEVEGLVREGVVDPRQLVDALGDVREFVRVGEVS